MITFLTPSLQVKSTAKFTESKSQIKDFTVARALLVYANNQRQNLAHTLNKGEVQGSNKKPWKQKGTGRARVGNKRNPVWRTGGVAFGPRNNINFTSKLNAKEKDFVLVGALKQLDLYIVEKIEFTKTKQAQDFLNALKLGKVAILSSSNLRAFHNIPQVTTVTSSDLVNVYDLRNVKSIILDESAFKTLSDRLKLSITTKDNSAAKSKSPAKKSSEVKNA